MLPYYRQMFDDKLQVALSGADWVDLMRLGLSKGVAVGAMCDNLRHHIRAVHGVSAII